MTDDDLRRVMEEQPSIEVSSPTGWRGRWLGAEAYQVVVALMITACTLVMLWQIKQSTDLILAALLEATAASNREHAITRQMIEHVLANQEAQRKERQYMLQAIDDKVDVQTYVLTLDQKRRESLNLQMPDALRKQLINQRR